MINYYLPEKIEIDGCEYKIRNRGDYRVVLDVISVLNDIELSDSQKSYCASYIFYKNKIKAEHSIQAIEEMLNFINLGKNERDNKKTLVLMSWEKDFDIICAPVNKILGCEIRSVAYLHWWTFISGYMEIGECMFSTVISIRKKQKLGKKLDKWEQEFYRNNREKIDLQSDMTAEELELIKTLMGGDD